MTIWPNAPAFIAAVCSGLSTWNCPAAHCDCRLSRHLRRNSWNASVTGWWSHSSSSSGRGIRLLTFTFLLAHSGQHSDSLVHSLVLLASVLEDQFERLQSVLRTLGFCLGRDLRGFSRQFQD